MLISAVGVIVVGCEAIILLNHQVKISKMEPKIPQPMCYVDQMNTNLSVTEQEP